MNYERAFIIVLIINSIVTSIYILYNFIVRREKTKNDRSSYWVRAIVMFLCPIVGITLFLSAHVIYKFVFSKSVDLSEVIFSKERTESSINADVERESNLIPVEEALEVSDKEDVRSLMFSVTQMDFKKMLSVIALALDSSDSETSHYAASILQDVIDDFRLNVRKEYAKIQKLIEEGEADEGTVSRALALLGYINEILTQSVFMESEQLFMTELMNKLAGDVYKLDNRAMNPEQIGWVVLRTLDVKLYEDCALWCKRIKSIYPDTLESYSCCMQLYYAKNDRKNFFLVMDKLKKSDVVVDQKTLEILRMFS